MKPTAPLALALCLTLPFSAVSQQALPASAHPFTDPANLRGERVSPLNGHELPIDQGALGLAELLRKLNTRASILNIVAHPDDEDGGMLTLYARGFGARVTDLALTRGEGGQNFMTGDFEDALGLIRTQELLANDRYTGVSQMFGTEVDFGFSKTKEEAFAKWTHDRVLYDAVRAIRLVRPLVITATFIGNVTDGHGQHQVSGEIAQEAFKAAADPTVFPDQIAEGLLPWQALKIYARVPFAEVNSKGVFDYATGQYVPARFTNYVTGKVSTAKPNADVDVPEGITDPLLTTAAANAADIPSTFTANPNTPLSYAQFSRIGLGLQRTQISKYMRLPVAGSYDSGYTLYGSVLCNAPDNSRFPLKSSVILSEGRSPQSKDPCIPPAAELPPAPFLPKDLTDHPNFFTGIDTSIEGIASLVPNPGALIRDPLRIIAESIQDAQHAYDPHHPEACAKPLSDALTTLDLFLKVLERIDFPPDQKQNVLHELRIKRVQLNNALALALNLHLDSSASSADITAGSALPIHIVAKSPTTADVSLHSAELETPDGTVKRGPWDKTFDVENSKTWLVDISATPATITQPFFYRDNIEQPVYQLRNPDLRNAPQTPAALTAWATVNYQGAEITLGRIVHNGPQPISIIPPVSIASVPHATALPNGQTTAQLTATLHTDGTTSANINVQSPHNWSIEAKAAGPNSVNFFLHPTAPITGPQLFHVTAQTPDHHPYSEGYRAVGYPGLILTNYYTPATTRVVPVDLKLPAHVRIAYLPGTGDAVPEALASIGLAPTMITVADLTPSKLANFDTVILGVRAYTANPDLHGAPSQALLDFARNGGNVVVQYETSGLTSADAPYPLTLGGEKVVDETDPVQLLAATNPLLTTPNEITTADFNNWVAERGHGFMESWDPHYIALTETHDPGGPVTPAQLPQRGGLITATVGKGRWTYVAFALYRELPEAVPGAFRIFVNLLAPAR